MPSDRQTEIQARANAMPCGCDAAGAPPTTARWADIRWLLAELSRVQQERDEAYAKVVALAAGGDTASRCVMESANGLIEALTERNRAQAALDAASRALDELVAPDPDKPLDQRIRDEFADFQMVIKHCSEIYDDVSGGLVSKPNTLPSVVKALADDRTTALVEEEVREQTAGLRAERDALTQEIATLRQQIGDVAERLAGLQEGDSRSPDWYHAASIAEEWVRALLQKGQ